MCPRYYRIILKKMTHSHQSFGLKGSAPTLECHPTIIVLCSINFRYLHRASDHHQRAKMDRVFERAFSKVHGTVQKAIPDPEAQQAAKALSEEERLRQETAPMTAADAVQRIALAFNDGDYFRCEGTMGACH